MDTLVVLLVALGIILHTQDSLAACPRKCNCDTELVVNCAYEELTEFPEGLPIEMEELNIADNWIQALPSLSIYTELKMLNVSGNRLVKISPSTFFGLRKLSYLDLSANNIAKLSDINAMTAFTTNDNLETLILSRNVITNFDSRVPNSLIISNSLQNLDISMNKISTVNNMTLFGLPNLLNLNMSRNPLKWILRLQSNSLTYLDISNGHMDSLNRNDLERLPKLETLKLSRNTKFNLFFEPVHSVSLIRYEAEFCQLQSPGLQDMPNLRYALLKGNKIEVLRAKALTRNTQMTLLDLTANVLRDIEPDSFMGLENIERLYLGDNQITELSWDMLITNHELKYLNLSKNQISTIPGNLTLSKLSVLEMSQCRIRYLEATTFTRMPFLAVLDLSFNDLEEIPNSLESNSLKIINLSHNRIMKLTNETFHKCPNLVSLNLIGNRMANVPGANIFNSNTFIKSIQFSDNPWTCECKNREFKMLWEFLTEPPAKVDPVERNSLKCILPKEVEGKSWESACYFDFYPPSQEGSFFDHYGVYLLIIALAICFSLVISLSIKKRMKRRRKRQRSRLEAQRRASRGSQDRLRRQSAVSGEVVVMVPQMDQVISLHERVVSQPPTYEEAVLLPRREFSSRADLQEESPSDSTPGVAPVEAVEPNGDVLTSETLDEADQPPLPKITDYNEDDDHDYEEVASDPEDDVEEVTTEDPEIEQAKLMSELRIDVWSRNDHEQ